MNKIIVSIIIVSWNSKEYLEKCLRSIVQIPLEITHEIIVVDNGSSDGSPEMVQEYFPEVKVIRNVANYGFAKANNIGIEYSVGEYICFVNSDVEVLRGCIEKLHEYMVRNIDIALIGPKLYGKNREIQRSCMGFPSLFDLLCRALALDAIFPHMSIFGRHLMTYFAHDSIREVDVINGCFWVVRRAALSVVGLLDVNFFIYAEDIDWCKRFHNAGWKVVFFPEAEAIHYGGASSSNAPLKFYIEMQKANWLYWKKYYGIISQFAYKAIRMLHEVLRIVGHALDALLRPYNRSLSFYKVRRSWAGIKWIVGVRTPPL